MSTNSDNSKKINWGSDDPNQFMANATPEVSTAPETSDDSFGDLFADVEVPATPEPVKENPAPTWTADLWDRRASVALYVRQLLGVVANDQLVSQQLTHISMTNDRALDAQQRDQFRQILSEYAIRNNIGQGHGKGDVQLMFDVAYDDFVGLGPLAPLWWDEEVTEILVDDYNSVYVERFGEMVESPARFEDLQHAQLLAKQLAERFSGRSISNSNPTATCELPGARVTFAYGDIVRTGISITIRKFRPLLGMSALLERGALSEEMAEFLSDAVIGRATILVSGGTGTGKTTMINALSESIPASERVVTIEDSYELQLANRFKVNLQSKERTTADSVTEVTQADLMVNALRMRPDRILVGEIREPEGAKVMLQAANTGHDGTMSTIHANTSFAAVNFRLANLVQTASGMQTNVAMREVATAIDLVIQVTRSAGRRFISEIAVIEPNSINGDAIEPEVIFTGQLNAEGEPEFRREGRIGSETVLAIKLSEAGLDPTRWGGI